MQLIITIDMDNAAFTEHQVNGVETARILRGLATWMDEAHISEKAVGILFDVNGNRVGTWKTNGNRVGNLRAKG